MLKLLLVRGGTQLGFVCSDSNIVAHFSVRLHLTFPYRDYALTRVFNDKKKSHLVSKARRSNAHVGESHAVDKKGQDLMQNIEFSLVDKLSIGKRGDEAI